MLVELYSFNAASSLELVSLTATSSLELVSFKATSWLELELFSLKVKSGQRLDRDASYIPVYYTPYWAIHHTPAA